MKLRKSGRRMLSTLAGLTVLLAGVPVIAAENSRAQVNEASAFCQQGEPEEAQRILDQVVQDMRTQPKTRTN